MIVCIASVILASCSHDKTSKTNDSKPLEFVFITTCVSEDFFIPVKKGMEEAASLLGVKCSFIGTEDVDLEQQVNMVREAVKTGVDGIALSIIDTLAFDVVVREAMDNGIPVVAFNVDDNKTPNARLSGICQNLYKAGYDLGKHMAALIPDNSTILMTLHSRGISALDDRLKGQQDALAGKNITWEVVITGTDADTASVIIADALLNHPEIKYVLCTGQADTEGAGIAVEKHFGNKGYLVAGFDLSPEILRLIKGGHILFTIDQQPYMQGFYPVIQLFQYCRYGLLPSDNEIVASVVDSSNAEEVEILCSKHYR